MPASNGSRPLGIAHVTVLEVPPAALVCLAARIGYRSVGLRLHPAFPGAPFYEIPRGSDAMRELRRRLDGEGIRVYDVEFVTVGADFVPAPLAGILASASEPGAERLSVCGDDPDHARQVASLAALCDLAAEIGMGVDLECMAWRHVNSLSAAIRVDEAPGRTNGGAPVDARHLSRTAASPSMSVPRSVWRGGAGEGDLGDVGGKSGGEHGPLITMLVLPGVEQCARRPKQRRSCIDPVVRRAQHAAAEQRLPQRLRIRRLHAGNGGDQAVLVGGGEMAVVAGRLFPLVDVAPQVVAHL